MTVCLTDAGETRYSYAGVSNLAMYTNPLGQIFYDHTYYKGQKKRYCDMTGNDVTYTYRTGDTLQRKAGSSS